MRELRRRRWVLSIKDLLKFAILKFEHFEDEEERRKIHVEKKKNKWKKMKWHIWSTKKRRRKD